MACNHHNNNHHHHHNMSSSFACLAALLVAYISVSVSASRLVDGSNTPPATLKNNIEKAFAQNNILSQIASRINKTSKIMGGGVTKTPRSTTTAPPASPNQPRYVKAETFENDTATFPTSKLNRTDIKSLKLFIYIFRIQKASSKRRQLSRPSGKRKSTRDIGTCGLYRRNIHIKLFILDQRGNKLKNIAEHKTSICKSEYESIELPVTLLDILSKFKNVQIKIECDNCNRKTFFSPSHIKKRRCRKPPKKEKRSNMTKKERRRRRRRRMRRRNRRRKLRKNKKELRSKDNNSHRRKRLRKCSKREAEKDAREQEADRRPFIVTTLINEDEG